VQRLPLTPLTHGPGHAWQAMPPWPHTALLLVPAWHAAPSQQPVQQLPERHRPPGHVERSAFGPVAVQTSVAQLVVPFWQVLLGVQVWSHAVQPPAPSHVELPEQPATGPMGRFVLSLHTQLVPERANAPVLHVVGFPEHALPSAHVTHAPALQKPVGQTTPSDWSAPSTQALAPPAHEVTPCLHGFGFVVHAAPSLHAMHMPAPSQTWFVPQLTPAPRFLFVSLHVGAEPLQSCAPALHGVGLPVQPPS
jgi:hypothetical protein